jgi:hypothetical protein
MAGQSNMQGWQGDAKDYPADVRDLDKRIAFSRVTPGFGSSNGQWLSLQPQPGRFPAGHFGPEITFARKLADAGYRPAIFKYALGSTSIAQHWKLPGEQGLYDQMVSTLREAITSLEHQGHTVRWRGLVWLQGESDAEIPAMAMLYGLRLQTFLRDFRKQVATDSLLPIILGVDAEHGWVEANPAVLTSQQTIAAEDPRMAFVSASGLERDADAAHLTPKGLMAHGERLFAAYAALTPVANTKAKRQARRGMVGPLQAVQ